MQTNSNNDLHEMLASAVAIICMLVIAYVLLGHPGIEAPQVTP